MTHGIATSIMKPQIQFLGAFALCFCFAGCGPSHSSLSDVSDQLTKQFRSQHESFHDAEQPALRSASITEFRADSTITIEMDWADGSTTFDEGVQLIHLGDGIAGVTCSDMKSKQKTLSAVISFR